MQERARVLVYSDYLSEKELGSAHLEKTENIERTVVEALEATGPDSRLCLLPEGPHSKFQ